MSHLFSRGSIYTFGRAVQLAGGILVVPIISRLLAPAEYGEVATALVIYLGLSIIAGGGLPEAAARAYFHDHEGPRAAHRLVIGTLVVAICVSACVELTGSLWAPLLSLDYSGALRLAVWAGGALAVMTAAQSVLRAADHAWKFVAVATLASVGTQALGVGLVAIFRTPSSYFVGVAIGTGLAALLALTLTGSLAQGLPSGKQLRSGLTLGIPLIPHSFSLYLLASADRIAIAAVLGLGAAGRYQVAYAVGTIGVTFATALNQAWIPLILGSTGERRWQILTETSKVVHQVAAVTAGGLAIAAPLGLLVAAPASYGRAELVSVSAVVAFSVVPYVTLSTYFLVIFASGRTKVFAVAAPAAALVNLGLNFILLPYLGLVGAAVATVAAYVVLVTIVRTISERMVRLPGALKTALVAWMFAVPLVALGALLPATTVGTCVRLLVGAGLAAVALPILSRLIRARRAESPQTEGHQPHPMPS